MSARATNDEEVLDVSDVKSRADAASDGAAVDRLGMLKVGGAAMLGGAIVLGADAAPALAASDPTGAAGGSLSGSYPNPSIAAGAITDSMIAVGAAIAESKLALASDAAQSTPSRRSIGTGAQQAAPGTPIAVLEYAAGGSGGTYSRTYPYNTHVAVDAANLQVSFTAPDTGAVLVTLNAPVQTSSSGAYVGWSVMEGGAAVYPGIGTLTNSQAWLRQTVQFRLSGLTPGSQHTYTWGWYGIGSSGTTINMSSNSIWGFVSMTVERCA